MEVLKALQTNARINLLCSHIFMVTGKITSFGISSDAGSNLPLSATSPETGQRLLCHGDKVLLMQASERCDGRCLCGARGPRSGREAAGRGSGESLKKKKICLLADLEKCPLMTLSLNFIRKYRLEYLPSSILIRIK